MCCTYCMMSSFQNLLHSSMFLMTCDCVIWCNWCVTMWSCHSNPNHSSKNRIKINQKENRNEKKMKIIRAFSFDIRPLLFTWLGISKIRKLTWPNQMRSMTYKILAKLLGNSFLPSIKLDRTHLSLTFTTIPLDKRYYFTVPQRLT